MTSQADIAVRELARQDLEAWQGFVDSMPDAGGMHHAGWYEVLGDAYWVTPHFLMAMNRDGRIVGVLSLYHSRSLVTGPYLSSLEDGVLAARSDAVHALLEAARGLRDRLRARYLQVRGGAIDGAAATAMPTVRTFLATGQPADHLWSAIKKKTRWAIRQAEKQPLVVEQDADLRELPAFHRIYAEHVHALGTPVMGVDGLHALRHRLGTRRLRLYLVRHRGSLIGGMLCIVNAGRWMDYLALVRPNKEVPFANYLLYWHVIRDASICGVPRFDMGRSTPDSNVHLFKRKWGGFDVETPYYFYPTPGMRAGDMGLQRLKAGRGLPQRVWSHLPLSLCNRVGPLLRKQLPFI